MMMIVLELPKFFLFPFIDSVFINMTQFPIYTVDAFTQNAFSGNPAGVVILENAQIIQNGNLESRNERITNVHYTTQETTLSGKTFQKIAAEMNLSETAFVVPLYIPNQSNEIHKQNNVENNPLQNTIDKNENVPLFALRWFSPSNEVHFCGHGTLGTSHVLFTKYQHLLYRPNSQTFNHTHAPSSSSLSSSTSSPLLYDCIQFDTLYGLLTVERVDSGKYRMLFPKGEPESIFTLIKKDTLNQILYDLSLNPEIDQVLDVVLCKKTKKLMLRFQSIDSVLKAQPHLNELLKFDFHGDETLKTFVKGIIVNTQIKPTTNLNTNSTTNSNTNLNTSTNIINENKYHSIQYLQEQGYDFVSRYFSPWNGIPEDPVNGSGHTLQAVYWGNKLGKKELKAYQLSKRGGELFMTLNDEDFNMYLSGYAVTVLEGKIFLESE